MAALTPTATQVQPVSGAPIAYGFAGATITAGQVLYIDTAAGDVLKLAQCDGTAAEAVVCGIALNGGSTGQPIAYCTGVSITLGAAAAMTVGEVYYLSPTAGSIGQVGDLSSTNRIVTLGPASTAAILALRIHNSLALKA